MRFENEFEFLSNFVPCEIVVLELKFPTLEHAFQASKTLWESERITISQLPTPGKAKRMGKKIHLRSDWERIKINVMFELLQQKFSQPLFKDLLLNTSDIEIVEDTWDDQFWGVVDGSGSNHLGKLLMVIRDNLKK